MNQLQIKEYLNKIIVIWEMISKENSNDASAYDYISVKATSLHMMAVTLKDHYEEIIEKDYEDKIKYTRLHKSLSNIVSSLNHKIKTDKDKEYIESILGNVLKVKDDIEVLKIYI